MLYADPGPIVKFWWKGVDIAVTVSSSVLSAAIFAFAAIATWNWKKGRDLRFEREKKEQEHSLERVRELERRRGKVQIMKHELGGFRYELDQLISRFRAEALTDIHIRIHEWLLSSGLALVGLNVRLEIDLRRLLPSQVERMQMLPMHTFTLAQLRSLAENLDQLEIPALENDGFRW